MKIENCKRNVKFIRLSVAVVAVLASCQKDLPLSDDTGFPTRINTIMSTRCATTGCHTDADKDAAGGLSLETWDDLMRGGNGGAVVIPYRSNRSLVHLYTNTFPDLGPTLKPTMPLNDQPLSRDDVVLIKNWIDSGAPNVSGNVAFGEPHLDKFYITNQGCDEIAVVDARTKLASRYIAVGVSPQTEAPHAVKISPDGAFAYVTFSLGTVVQKIDCRTDKVVGSLDAGFGLWNSIAISGDGTKAVIADWQASNGQIKILDLDAFTVMQTFTGIDNGHGLAVTPDFNTVYCTNQPGSQLYRIDISDLNNPNFSLVDLGNGAQDPHDIIFSPDASRYFVACQTSGDVRVFQTSNDSLLAVLPTGAYPQELAVSTTQPYLFITCSEEPSSVPKTRGAVYVFNYNTLSTQPVKILSEQLFQPHGIAVDDQNGVVLVASRNIDANGPAPHHSTDCAGRAGYFRMVDLNTLEFVPGLRSELSVDPYGVAARVVW